MVHQQRSLEGLTEADPQLRPTLEGTGRDLNSVELETPVESEGPDWRFVPQPEPDGSPQLTKIDIARAREHVAAIEEPDHAEAPPHRRAHLRVEDDEAIAADREPACVDRVARPRRIVVNPQTIEREAPH